MYGKYYRKTTLRMGRWSCSRWYLILVAVLLFVHNAYMSQAQTNPTIILATNAAPSEVTAAKDLAMYFGKMIGADFTVCPEAEAGIQPGAVYVGPTAFARTNGVDCAAFGAEEWVLKSVGTRLIVAGGRPRGTLYAAYHLLEDIYGVRWWNPWEETVPKHASLVWPQVNIRKKPVIAYRDIYMIEGPGGFSGATPFCVRNRLNRNGAAAIAREYGGEMGYGRPNSEHTFSMYCPPTEYYNAHPEWFPEVDGKRMKGKLYQLCTTNPELRQFMLEKLRAYIAQSRANAEKAGLAAPLVYDVSQNDCGGFCECRKCKEFETREGSQAGPYLDLVNYLADGIRSQHPDICISTLAYRQTQKLPRTIKPRDNVIIRLCDTGSNIAKPITDPDNKPFYDIMTSWSAVCKHLRIWRYAITYGPYSVLPFASAQVYGPDMRFYAEHNVEGVFTEHEGGIIGDMRDFKIWIQAKFMEDPYRDYQALVEDFTDGYYGPAGPVIRDYLIALQTAQEKAGSFIGWTCPPLHFKHLDLPFLVKAQGMFDRAEKRVQDDPVLLRRVRHARLSLDRATLVRYKTLARSWKGNGPMPLDREAIAAREKNTWLTLIELRIPPQRQAKARADAEREIGVLLAQQINVPLPEQFRNLPQGSVWDYVPEDFRNWSVHKDAKIAVKDEARIVPDKDAEIGLTDRIELSDEAMQKYKLPMPWGIYDLPHANYIPPATVLPENIPGPGYHWYKLPSVSLGDGYYVYFFKSWAIQCDIATEGEPDDKFDIWARIKFEGPGFPHGNKTQNNAVCVERIVVVKAEKH